MKAVHLLIHGFFIFGSIVYMGMYVFLLQGKQTGQGAQPVSTGLDAMTWILIGVACADIVGGAIWPWIQRILPARGPLSNRVGLLNTIMTDAMFEAAAITGMVGLFVGTPPLVSWALMICGFLAILFNTPRVLRWLST